MGSAQSQHQPGYLCRPYGNVITRVPLMWHLPRYTAAGTEFLKRILAALWQRIRICLDSDLLDTPPCIPEHQDVLS